ncbi:MAG: ATP-binding protein [Candidatus Cryosericum sp.]
MARTLSNGETTTSAIRVTQHRTSVRQAVVLLLLAAILGTVCWRMTVWFRGQRLYDVRSAVTVSAVGHAISLSESIDRRFALLRGLAAFAATNARPHEAEPGFDTFVPLLANSVTGIRNMGVMPDGTTKYIYPLKGNESVLGLSIYNDDRPEVRAAVERALATHQITVNDPYILRQGGLGLVARVGVWQGATLWGMVTTVLDMPVVLSDAGISLDDGVARVALRDQRGTVFFGDKTIFESSPVIERVELVDGSWELASVPLAGWEGAAHNDVRAFALVGSTIGLLILLVGYLVLSRNSRLEQMIATRTKELKEAAVQQALLTQTIPDGIVFIDASGTFTYANAAAEHILDLQIGALKKRTYDDPAWNIQALDGGPFPPEQLPFIQVKTGLKPVSNVQHAIIWPDGQRRLLNVNAAPVPGADGGFTGMVASLQDITERTRDEEEKAALKAQLIQSQKMEAIGQLAGGVAHDFNNLLTGILGNVAIVKDSLPASDPLLDNLNLVESAAHKAADLTKGLLTFGRRAVISVVPVDLAAVIDTTLAILKQSLPATMTIARDFVQPVWSVLADPSQTSQMILNLAINARDAMHGEGTLTFLLRNEAVESNYVNQHRFAHVGEYVHLCVHDTGPGIPDAIMEHLFEPFYTTKPEGSGTGLGLSIVYGVVKQSGGWITADSPESGGAVFDIFLPRCLAEAASSCAPAPATVPTGSGTVLVVEDEPVVSVVAQTFLSRIGYTVLAAQDGTSALATLRGHPGAIDLVLLDMTMPGMTTDDIVHAIRAIDAHVPILLTSGYTSSGTVQRMLDDGSVQGFLAKPYDMTQMLDTVQKLLPTS